MSSPITPANAASLLSEEIAKTAPEHKAKVRHIVASSVGENPILMADMYKATHAGQLPDKTETITSFFEARVGPSSEYSGPLARIQITKFANPTFEPPSC